MSNRALKFLGITALLGLIGFLAYKSLKKCDTQTPNEESPISSSGSLGTEQYTSIDKYGSSGSLGTNQYTSVFNTWESNFSPSQFESLPTGLIFSYYDKVGIGSSGSIGTWRYIYKSAIGTSQYNNRWW
jgi:hypothetical protein